LHQVKPVSLTPSLPFITGQALKENNMAKAGKLSIFADDILKARVFSLHLPGERNKELYRRNLIMIIIGLIVS
jgi:hypothetical protein